MTPDPEEARRRPAGARRWRRRVLALAVGLGLPVLAGEVAVRTTVGAPRAERLPIVRVQANPHRGWEMVPGEAHYTYQHRVRVNALGLRGEEVGPKAEGERRVLALGDSLVYGQGVADDETVPAYLETELRAAAPDVRWDVVNAGHRAYDTHQELGLLEELGEAIAPDVVVVFWYWNDIHERDIDGTYERLKASGPIHFDTGDRLEGTQRWAWRGKELLRRSALVMALWDLWATKQGQPETEGYVDAAFERLEGYLARFRALAEQHGYALVFAPIPDASGLLGEHQSEALRARASALAAAAGLPVVDLHAPLAALARRAGEPPVIPFDGHYLPAANAVIARAVAQALAP